MEEVKPVSKEEASKSYKESLERLKNSIEKIEANPLLYSENVEFYSKMVADAKELKTYRDFMKLS